MKHQKKILPAVLLVLSLALLSACGEQPAAVSGAEQPGALETETPSAAPAAAEETPPEEDASEPDYGPLYYTYGDCSFGIMDEADWVLSALGEPFDTFTAASCAYQGDDYFYYYDGIEVTVNDLDGVLRITGITLADDTVRSPQGLYIGQNIDDAVACLDGIEYTESGGVYSYVYGSTLLLLQAAADGDIVAISYSAL